MKQYFFHSRFRYKSSPSQQTWEEPPPSHLCLRRIEPLTTATSCHCEQWLRHVSVEDSVFASCFIFFWLNLPTNSIFRFYHLFLFNANLIPLLFDFTSFLLLGSFPRQFFTPAQCKCNYRCSIRWQYSFSWWTIRTTSWNIRFTNRYLLPNYNNLFLLAFRYSQIRKLLFIQILKIY